MQPSATSSGDALGRVAAIDRSTLAEEIYRRLRRAILSGEIPAEERVQPDRLAQVIGVSRTPVREALQRLLAEGYLEQEARHAFRVAAVDFQSGRDLFAIRAVLEGLAARLAATTMSEEEREDLRHTIEAARHTEDEDVWSDKAAGDFHRMIYRASGNKHLASQLDRVFDQTLRYRYITRSDSEERQRATIHDHDLIFEALLKGDGDAAEKAMQNHIAELASRMDESGS